MHFWGRKERIEILDKIRERRRQWVPAIEVPHAYVRYEIRLQFIFGCS